MSALDEKVNRNPQPGRLFIALKIGMRNSVVSIQGSLLTTGGRENLNWGATIRNHLSQYIVVESSYSWTVKFKIAPDAGGCQLIPFKLVDVKSYSP